ncbi:MAG: Peroxide stress regulator [Bacteriovoracaceae bacterium]|nr:Peroxide stress regulator [Bacteriovoracaceae bacterium]
MEQGIIINRNTKAIRDSLKNAGIQPSASRMAIASFVWNTDSHPTAEEVKIEVEKAFPTVSLATVYNTLNLFVEKGLLKEVQDSNQRSVRYDCNTTPHFHFIDEATGQMMDLDPEVLRISPDLSKLGAEFKIREIEVTLRGRKMGTPQDKVKQK